MNQAAISLIAAYGLLLNGPYMVAVYARTYLLRSQAGDDKNWTRTGTVILTPEWLHFPVSSFRF